MEIDTNNVTKFSFTAICSNSAHAELTKRFIDVIVCVWVLYTAFAWTSSDSIISKPTKNANSFPLFFMVIIVYKEFALGLAVKVRVWCQ